MSMRRELGRLLTTVALSPRNTLTVSHTGHDPTLLSWRRRRNRLF